MLQAIREKTQGWIAWIVVLAIGTVFVLWGVGDFIGMNGKESIAAQVDGEKISWHEVDAFYERILRQQNALTQSQGFDPKEVKMMALQNLIDSRVLTRASLKQGFTISEGQIREILTSIPEFQENGLFSNEKYQMALSAALYSDQAFRQEIKSSLLINQLQQGLIESAFTLPEEISTLVKFIDQRRDVVYTKVPVSRFEESIKVTDSEIQDYYAGHPESFVTEEKVGLDFILLSADQIKTDGLTPTDSEMASYYEKNIHVFTTPERLKVAHILIAVRNFQDQNEVKAAQAKISDIQKQFKAGKSFEALAKSYSDDTGSASIGGELTWLTKGEMVPEFEQVAFSLKHTGQVSDSVKTPFGFHLIKLIEKQPQQKASLDQVKEAISEELIRQKTEEQLTQIADELSTLAYEHPDSLEPLAQKFDLTIEQSPLLTRQEEGEGWFANKGVLNAAFSEEVLTNRHNSDVIQLDASHFIVVRVARHVPSERLSLEKVKGEIKETLLMAQAEKQAEKFATEIQQSIKAGENFHTVASKHQMNWTTQKGLTRQSIREIDGEILHKAFSLPRTATDKPGVGTVQLENGDFAVVMVTHIQDGNTSGFDAERQKFFQQGFAKTLGQIDYNLFVSGAFESAKIENNQNELDVEQEEN